MGAFAQKEILRAALLIKDTRLEYSDSWTEAGREVILRVEAAREMILRIEVGREARLTKGMPAAMNGIPGCRG